MFVLTLHCLVMNVLLYFILFLLVVIKENKKQTNENPGYSIMKDVF